VATPLRARIVARKTMKGHVGLGFVVVRSRLRWAYRWFQASDGANFSEMYSSYRNKISCKN
jgi:hypothetical protein